MQNKVLILDGRNLLWRTSDSFAMLYTEVEGKEIGVGGIYGFLSVGLRLHNRYGGKVIVAWEGVNNFRYNIYPQYKKKETKVEEDITRIEFKKDLMKQEIRLKAILRAMGVDQYEGDGCEADDVLATLANKYASDGIPAIIYTNDSDLRQSVRFGIRVVAPGMRGKDMVYNNALEVFKKDGVAPVQVPDLKALAGDTSDNIPGVMGVGPETAKKLLGRFNTVEDIITGTQEAADEDWPVGVRFRKIIWEARHDLRKYKKLTVVLINANMSKIEANKNQSRVVNYLKLYKFRSLCSHAELNGLMNMGEF